MRIRRFLLTLNMMVREEIRLRSAFTSTLAFIFFPLWLYLISFMFGIVHESFVKEMGISKIILYGHYAVILFAVMMSFFSFHGAEILEARFGRINTLLRADRLLPVDFRTLVSVYYVKELLLYAVLFILPVPAGLLSSSPISGIRVSSIAVLTVSVFSTFSIAVALAFALSALYYRSRVLFLAGIGMLLPLFLAPLHPSLPPPMGSAPFLLFPGILFHMSWYSGTAHYSYLALSLLNFSLLSAVVPICRFQDVMTVKTHPFAYGRYEKLTRFLGYRSPLVAKELLDMRRSGALQKQIVFLFIPFIPILMFRFFGERGSSMVMDFNLVMFSGLIGFLSISIYVWTNNVENPAYYATLPVSLSDVIEAKILVSLLLSLIMVPTMVVAVAMALGHPQLIVLILVIAMSVSCYGTAVMAYLSEIHPNNRMLDVKSLLAFFFIIGVPLIPLSLLIMGTSHLIRSLLVIHIALIYLGAYVVYRATLIKWERGSF